MTSLSKIALASATIAAIVSLSACGGGGGGGGATTTSKDPYVPAINPVIPVNVVLGVPAVQYPASCGEFDAYCRLVAGKDAIVDVELDASVTAFRLQITPVESTGLLPSTVPADCSEACWNEARNKATTVLHLPGTQLSKAGKNVFRVRVPAHLNEPSIYWSASFDGPVATDAGIVGKTYIPKPLTRNYFKGDPIDLVVVPMRINGVVPANFPNIFQIANKVGVKIPLPLSTIRIGATVDIPNATTLSTIDEYNAALRAFTQQAGAGSGRTYWYGIFNQAVRKGGLAGIGYQPGNSAIGWDDPNQWYRTMTHEAGHNLGLPHTACGNPGSVDPSYPYPNGDLSAPYPSPTAFRYPFDLSQGLEQVQENKDVMGYCGGNYFSDYNIAQVWKFMQPGAVVPLYDVADTTVATPKIQTKSLAALSKSYTLEDVHKRWDVAPPKPTQGPAGTGHVFSWKSGPSNALVVKKVTTTAEKSLSGIAVEVQHADGYWYTGVAYRTSEESSLDIWTPGVGAPIAIRVPGM